MSTTGISVDLEPGVPEVDLVEGAVGTLQAAGMFGQFGDLYGFDDVAAWGTDMQDRVNAAYNAEIAAAINDLGVVTSSITEAGLVTPLEVPAFYQWLYEYQGVEQLTQSFVEGANLQVFAVAWAEQTGNIANFMPNPGTPASVASAAPPLPTPAPVTYPSAPPTAAPSTPGGTIVKQVVEKTVVETVSTSALDAAVGKAVSQGLTVLYNDLTALVAQAVDQSLGGLQPGHVKAAISRLNSADARIKSLFTALVGEINGTVLPDLFLSVEGLTANEAADATNITTLQDQVAGTKDSKLRADIYALDNDVGTLQSQMSTVTGQSIPDLAAGLMAANLAQVGLSNIVDNEVLPNLSTLNTDMTNVQSTLALTTEECLAELCDAENSVTNPIQNGGATPSLLGWLGKLLSGAFGLLTAIGLAETVFTLLDAQAAVEGVVSDVETLSTWADSAANAIMSDLSWQGSL